GRETPGQVAFRRLRLLRRHAPRVLQELHWSDRGAAGEAESHHRTGDRGHLGQPRPRLQRQVPGAPDSAHRQGDERGRPLFAAHGIPDGDMGKYAAGLTAALKNDFTAEMNRLRDKAFQALLTKYPRKHDPFIRATENEDTVTSEYLFRDGAG